MEEVYTAAFLAKIKEKRPLDNSDLQNCGLYIKFLLNSNLSEFLNERFRQLLEENRVWFS
jgi:hypothetical protein